MISYSVNVTPDLTRETCPTWRFQTSNKRAALAAAHKIRHDGYLIAGYPFAPLHEISVTARRGSIVWRIA